MHLVVARLDSDPLSLCLRRTLPRTARNYCSRLPISKGLWYRLQLQLLQLYTFNIHPHALDPANQPSRLGSLDTKSRCSLADALFVASQHPLHHAVHIAGGDTEHRTNGSPGRVPSLLLHQHTALFDWRLCSSLRCDVCVRLAPSRQYTLRMARGHTF